MIDGDGAAGSAIWNQEGVMEQTGTQGRLAFVYGPVKRGGPLHHRLAPAELVGSAVLPGFRMFQVGAAPCIIPSPRPDDEVRGEVWRISEHQLRLLDLVEGGAYRRTHGVARLENGSRVEVVTWAWAFSEFGLRPIPSGDWDVSRRQVIRPADPTRHKEMDERAS
jgi:gamma-glutamylaminecyclotransferase